MRRLIAIAMLLSTACAGTAPSVPTMPAPLPADDGIEVRLGCDVVTRRDVDAALEEARRHDGSVTRDTVRDRLVRRDVVERLARELGVDVDEAMIDRAVETVARTANLEVDGLYEAAGAQGYDRAGYRSELRAQLLEARVGQLIVGAPDEGIDEAARAERWQRAMEDAFARATQRRMAARVRAGPRGCVEVTSDR